MNVKRLTILRDALIEHAKDQGNLVFDLWTWIKAPHVDYVGDGPTQAVIAAAKGDNHCGTTACAVGLAMCIPAFRRAGFRANGTEPTYRGNRNWEAVTAFFDIHHADAEELFLSRLYDDEDQKNPLAVADKITALLHCA